jgi:hypothetical protein
MGIKPFYKKSFGAIPAFCKDSFAHDAAEAQ